MKRSHIIICLFAGACGLASAGTGWGTTIDDNYIGGIYTLIDEPQPPYDDIPTLYSESRDIISGGAPYDIQKMVVNIGTTITTIDVYTNYVNKVAFDENIEYGDLFLSNNGWNPYGDTTEDYYGNGEFWEFALVLANHSGTATEGIASLYAITSTSEYILAENTGSSVYRAGQEVQFNTFYYDTQSETLLAKTPLATGSWSVFSDGSGTGLHFTIGTSLLNLGTDDLGLRWAMTCANDIIEGSTPVPEPVTMLLFGTGLVGLAGIGRRKRK